MALKPAIDYTHKDYASLRLAMLELARYRLPEWNDRSPADDIAVLGILSTNVPCHRHAKWGAWPRTGCPAALPCRLPSLRRPAHLPQSNFV